jgi:hypothetical protein
MSYSAADRNRFQAEAVQEASRIHMLTSSLPVPTGVAIYNLIENNLLSKEELIGIEHLIGQGTALPVYCERHSHTNAVLRMQKEMQKKNVTNAEVLAQFARTRSSKSSKRASMRALLAT